MSLKQWIATASAANNFHITTNWSPSGDPSSNDDLYFGTNSISCNMTSTGTASCIIFASYSGTFSITSNLTLTGNSGKTFSYSPYMNFGASTGTIILANNFNLLSNGSTPSIATQLLSSTASFLDNWNQNANWTNSGTSTTFNGSVTYSQLSGILNVAGGGSYLYGNLSTLQIRGGVLTGNAYIGLPNIYINPIISVTLTGPLSFIVPSNPTISYSGTGLVNVSGALNINNATFNTNGITWSTISTNNSATWSLASNLQTSGVVTITNNTIVSVNGSYSMYFTGISSGSGAFLSSTQSSLYLIGGNTSFNGAPGIALNTYLQGNNNISLLTFGGNSTLTYLSGGCTISTLYVCREFYTPGSATLNLNGTSYIGTIAIGQKTATSSYITLTSPLNATTITYGDSGTLYPYGTFTGSYGFTTQILSNNMNTAVLQLNTGVNYLITGTISNILSSNTTRAIIQSLITGTKATLTLLNGAKCNLGYQNAIDIDSSAGRTINSFNGTFSNTLNWKSFNDLSTVSYTNQS